MKAKNKGVIVQERSVHSLIQLLYPQVGCIHLQVQSVTRYLPTGIPVHEFFIERNELLTCKNKFLPQLELSPTGQIFTLQEPIFSTLINVLPLTYWKIVTNNLTAVIKVALINVVLSVALL